MGKREVILIASSPCQPRSQVSSGRQGLLEPEKYDVPLKQQLLRKFPGGVSPERYAHSGAVIGDSPETVDLVLANGGINDIGVGTILNPASIIPSLHSRIVAACPKITFVPSGFTAVFAPGSALLWGLDNFLNPEDPVAGQRHAQCNIAFGGPLRILHREQCYRAAAGHPNVSGAVQLARQIHAALA